MTQFARTLRTWRTARRYSQLDLALEAQVSTRHLSFLETGRAQPSREMIARLSEALQLPLDARNRLLADAGFAPRYPARRWDSDEMAPIRRAVGTMLENHMPYPAIAVDRMWIVQRMNGAAARLYGALGLTEGGSLLELMTSPALRAVVENWREVAHHAGMRLRTESAAQGGVAAFDHVAAELMGVERPETRPTGPVVPTILRLGDLRLSLFATIAQFGTPEDVTLDDLKIELFFPLDNSTEAALRALASA